MGWLTHKVLLMVRRFLLATALFCLVQPLLADDHVAQTSATLEWQAFMNSSRTIIEMAKEQRAGRLAKLGAALLKDPVGVADDLERSSGGKGAVRAYTQSMIEDGNVAELIEQFHMVMHGGTSAASLADVFNNPQAQDGSVWFPQAEQAGFFAGGIAAVLDGRGGARLDEELRTGFINGVGQSFGVPAPQSQDNAREWMLKAFTGTASAVSVPAAQWFEKGFDDAYR